MADSYTTNLNLTLPEVGASRDTWGGKVNGDMSAIDALFNAAGNGTSVGLNVGAGKTISVGGTLNATGTVNLDTAVVINESGADKDVRIEGDTNANLFFTDASTDRVGIGTNSPTALLTVAGDQHIRSGFGLAYYDSGNSGYWANYNSSGAYIFSNGTERVRIDSSGNVGIGTSSPQKKFVVSNAGAVGMEWSPTDYSGNMRQLAYNRSTSAYVALRTEASQHELYIGSTEAARIDASGNLLVGTTGTVGGSTNQKIGISFAGNSVWGMAIKETDGANGSVFCNFVNSSNTVIGNITRASVSSVGYNTTSDYRLKEDVETLQNGLATISALNPVTYSWKGDGTQGEGFIAHELAEHIPLAVTGEKDAVDAEGNIKPQSVDYSKVVVHLVSAIQELKTELDAANARIAALEAK